MFAYRATRDQEFLRRRHAAPRNFLTRVAWDAPNAAMPFEIEPAAFTYFFDCWHHRARSAGPLARHRRMRTAGCRIGHRLIPWPAISRATMAHSGRYSRCPIRRRSSSTPPAGRVSRLLSVEVRRGLARTRRHHRRRRLERLLRARPSRRALASHESLSPRPYRSAPGDGPPSPLSLLSRSVAARTPEHAAFVREGAAPRCAIPSTTSRPHFDRADVAAQLLRIQCAAGSPESECAANRRSRAPLPARPMAATTSAAKRASGFPHVSPVPTVFAMQALEWYERRESIDCAAVI